MTARLRQWLFGISPTATSCRRRGFQVADAMVESRLEAIGASFLAGYHLALATPRAEPLGRSLAQLDGELRGFAFEGAAMALALLDELAPWRRRLDVFLRGPGDAHAYMVHVGAGWAMARLPWARRNIAARAARLHPLLGFLAIDGYGFHQGYFDWPASIDGQATPPNLTGYARRAFDQGLGRSMWFVRGADPAAVADCVGRFPASRRADLWSGAGLACAYAGPATRSAVAELRELAGDARDQLAQGAAFAAKARQRAGNPSAHTESACRVLCDCSADEAAAVTDEELVDLSASGDEPAYEVWRRRVRERLSAANQCGAAAGARP